MIIQKTYRLEKFIDSVLSVECMSQPPALRATSFQRKEGKQLDRVTVMEPIEPSDPAAPYEVIHEARYDLHCFLLYFIFAFTSSVRSAEIVP